MIEPEVAFMDLTELMDLEEDFIKHCVRWALEHCAEDLEFLNNMIDKTLLDRLHSVIDTEFVRLPYTEGIRLLEEAIAKGKQFEFPVYWGCDLASEHERYLVEEHFKKPVIMIDYPKEIKSFYMKTNEDGKTVQGTDVLFPQIGESSVVRFVKKTTIHSWLAPRKWEFRTKTFGGTSISANTARVRTPVSVSVSNA